MSRLAENMRDAFDMVSIDGCPVLDCDDFGLCEAVAIANSSTL